MIEPPEVFVLGPYRTNMFGKPGTRHAEVRVRAAAPSASCSVAPVARR